MSEGSVTEVALPYSACLGFLVSIGYIYIWIISDSVSTSIGFLMLSCEFFGLQFAALLKLFLTLIFELKL